MINLNKCNLSEAQIKDARRGISVEMEHTKSRKEAFNIAMQHECEFKGKLYYHDWLIPLEKRMRRTK